MGQVRYRRGGLRAHHERHDAAYTPVEGDDGMYLQATASYTDEEGGAKSATSEALGPVVTYSSPAFSAAAAATTMEVAEDTVAGENLGEPYTATDDDGDTPVYALSGTDAASFTIDSGTGQLMTSAALDYETKNLHGHRGGPGQRGRRRRRRHDGRRQH